MNYIAACILAASLFVAATSHAAAHSAGDPGDWTVDPSKSRLGFSGTQTGSKFDGTFKQYDAAIHFDPAHPQSGHATVTIDIASATTGDTQRDEAMPGADWFNAKQFPKAVFNAKRFESKGGSDYVATGTLTVRGITRNETLPFTLIVDGDTAHAKGRLELIRTEFGVGQGPWSSGQWVALEVGVDVDLLAHRSRS